MEVPSKMKNKTSTQSNSTTLCIYQKECKSAYNIDTCTLMFLAALFPIAKWWNKPRCLPTDKFKGNTWQSHQKNEILSFSGNNGIGDHHVKQNEQSEKNKYIFSLIKKENDTNVEWRLFGDEN
jgi:hypothetical protein